MFVCTGNSARSQMAEGFARHFGRGRVEACSAGMEPPISQPTSDASMRLTAGGLWCCRSCGGGESIASSPIALISSAAPFASLGSP